MEKDVDEMSTAIASVPIQTFQQEPVKKNTIVLKTHDGDGYVLPYLSWETTKLQIEQIYRLRHRESLADAVKDGKFSTLDEDGNIILPALWEQVVKPFATLQIVLSSDILDPEIASHYPYAKEATPRYRQRSLLAVLPDEDASSQEVLDVDNSAPDYVDGSSVSNEDSDLDSISSGSEVSESPAPVEISEDLLRQVTEPTDCDGNSLVFRVNTAFIGPQYQSSATADANNQPKKRDAQKSAGISEHLSITKAISTQSDGRTSLQIYTLPGPRTAFTETDITIRWLHLHSERLNFASFKETCLGITGLSGRLQKLVRQLLDKVEKEKLKLFLGGMFIEPGTVLRADESHQTDPQSVIFSCVPYFDLQIPAKRMPATTNPFSSRTLMQSYYPYEPVQDRDAEQAYRLFSNEQRDALIHVPNIWMLNIGPSVVATYGHQALAKDFVQSIEVIETNCLQAKERKDPTATIRLRDWDGRKLLYTVEECRSFFQMEQKLRELRWDSTRSRIEQSMQLLWKTSAGTVKVMPDLWPGIIKSRDSIFIDLIVSSGGSEEDKHNPPPQFSLERESLRVPFFHWPQSVDMGKTRTDGLISDDIERSIQCLENVEKAMLSEVLSSYGSYSAVKETFTTTAYYRSLPEETTEHVKSGIESLPMTTVQSRGPVSDGTTVHEVLVTRQRNMIGARTLDLYETMHKTVALFVGHVDKSTMLRKSWGAMKSIGDIANTICTRPPARDDTSISDNIRQPRTSQGWFVRPYMDGNKASASFEKVKQAFKRCRRCSSNKMYGTSNAALSHVNKHLRHLDPAVLDHVRPEQWIASYSQRELEVWNEGTVKILMTACRIAQQFFAEAKELSDGVRNGDGKMSALYTFPRPLLSAFRQVLIFYFAVERSLFYAEESLKDKRKDMESPEYMTALPFSLQGLQSIEAFGNGAQHALTVAREELCSMVKSKGPVEIFKRLYLSPEYVCGWLMRRLLVKPLEKSMTVSDMYREYMSTIQFQVNHRPGKRLLRSINLLQEELAALQEVNTQQSKLISSYMSVLDDTTYEKDIPSRRAMFPYERMLLESCRDSLKMTDQEYRYLLARCGPLSDSTKQSLEINEEDHGKAIMVFTIVTVIFLPLSFVTSFLGMNTTDIRDMGSSSTLFWSIAIPLTTITMGSVLYIGYNGDDLRDTFGSLYRTVTGKQDRNTKVRGISVAQRKLARKSATGSNITLDFSSLADEAEFANPGPEDYCNNTWRNGNHLPRRHFTLEAPGIQWETYASAANPVIPEPRTGLRTEPLKYDGFAPDRRNNEYLNPETSNQLEDELEELRLESNRARRGRYNRPAPNVTIYNTTRMDRPEAYVYNETTMRDNRHTRRHYSPPSNPPPTPPPPPPPPPPVRRSNWHVEDDWYTRRPPQYEWTKKSHRNHHYTQERTRRRRDDQDEWYEARPTGLRHVPAPRH